MEIRINIPLRGPLDTVLDQVILEVMKPYLVAAVVQPEIKVDTSQLTSHTDTFFDAHVGNDAIHDTYFYRFQAAWAVMFENGNLVRAQEVWDVALAPALAWEERNPGKRVHKGTPYFFKAFTALKAGDIESCYVLMHQAAQEDIARDGVPRPQKPAVFFITMNWDRDQFAKDWILQQRTVLDGLLNQYRGQHGRSLTSDTIQRRFLAVHDNLDTTVLFAYAIARIIKLNDLPQRARGEFTSQLKLNLLGDLNLVIDDILKLLFPQVWDFGKNILSLANTAQLPLTSAHLKEIQPLLANEQFEAGITSALAGTLTVAGAPIQGLARDVVIAYGLRNYRAHNVASAIIVAKRFDELVQSLFNVLFLALEVLLAERLDAAPGKEAKSPPR